jgi:hypothetical protein
VAGGDVGCETLIAEGAEALHPGEIDWDALAGRISEMVNEPAETD